MKTLQRITRITIGAVAALTVSFALMSATATAADGQIPLSARMSGTVTEAGCGLLTICASVTTYGIATHLGVTTLTKTVTVHITLNSCEDGGLLSTYTETATLVAANGDTLELSGAGTACASNGHAIGSGTLTITGGTGRFAEASGGLREAFDHNLITGTEVVNLNGTLTYHR